MHDENHSEIKHHVVDDVYASCPNALTLAELSLSKIW